MKKENKIDPMNEDYWKKKIERSIKRIGKDKLITKLQKEDLIKRLKKV